VVVYAYAVAARAATFGDAQHTRSPRTCLAPISSVWTESALSTTPITAWWLSGTAVVLGRRTNPANRPEAAVLHQWGRHGRATAIARAPSVLRSRHRRHPDS
jgi:hypothetical protein